MVPACLTAEADAWRAADDKPDIENMQIWAGVVPLSQQQVLAPEASEDLQPGIPVPEYLKAH